MAQSTASLLTPTATTYTKSKALTITAHIVRVILGLIFFVFGLNKFLQFIPVPPPEGIAGEFMFGLSKGPYMFPLIGLLEVSWRCFFTFRQTGSIGPVITLSHQPEYISFPPHPCS